MSDNLKIEKIKLGFRHRQYTPFDADERVVRSHELKLKQQILTFKFEDGAGINKIVVPQCTGEMTLYEILVTRKYGEIGRVDNTFDIPVRNRFVAQIDLEFDQATMYQEKGKDKNE